MKRFTIGIAALLCISAVASATDYTFVGTIFPAQWDNVDNWSPSLILPGDSSDNYLVTGPIGTSRINMPSQGWGNVRVFGDITVDNGQLYWGSGTYRFAADNGNTGSLIMTGAGARLGRIAWGDCEIFDMDGDFIYDPSQSGNQPSNALARADVIMRGNDVTYTFDSYTEDYNTIRKVTVDNGALVNFAPTSNNVRATMRYADIWGTAVGYIRMPYGTDERFKVMGSGDTTGLNLLVYAYHQNWAVVPGFTDRFGNGTLVQGKFNTYEFAAASWHSQGGAYIGRLPGALETVDYLRVGYSTAGSPDGGLVFIMDTDNYDLTVGGSVDVGTTSTSSEQIGGLDVKGSNVVIKGGIRFRYVKDATETNFSGGSFIRATDAQITVGGNWQVDCGTLSGADNWIVHGGAITGPGWDLGTSALTFDGAGVANAQTFTSGNLPYYTVKINNAGGSVTMADNLLIKGDLEILAGAFNTNGNVITFNGPDHLLNDQVGVTLDNVTLLANAIVQLASDIDMGKLVMGSASELYLNGFTLMANGETYDGTEVMNWTVGGGTIFGAESAQIPGDANGDGKVDGGDLSIWQANYDPIGVGNNTFATGDFNGDGKIDGGDLSIWQANYDPIGVVGVDGMGTAVPEPATMLLLGTGLLGALGVIRRRK